MNLDTPAVDLCADAVDLVASDFVDDGDWTIHSEQDAQPLLNARSLTGAVIFDGIDLSSLPEFPCLQTIEILWIRGTALVDLSAFRNLREVTDNLMVFQNTQLTSLEGLENLEHVRLMSVSQNERLVSPRGMPKLGTVDAKLSINFGDTEGATLDGFPPVGGPDLDLTVGGRFTDLSPLSVTNAAGYTIGGSNIRSVEGIPIRKHFETLALAGGTYTDLSPLRGIETIDELRIVGTRLRSLAGLETLRSFGDDVNDGSTLQDNDDLEDISALSGVESLGGSLELRNNPSLVSLEGLENIETMNRLSVRVCPSLTTLEPVLGGKLRSVESLRVTFNEQVPQCEADLLCQQLPGASCDVTGNADLSSALCR